jgi:hypothetical protein
VCFLIIALPSPIRKEAELTIPIGQSLLVKKSGGFGVQMLPLLLTSCDLAWVANISELHLIHFIRNLHEIMNSLFHMNLLNERLTTVLRTW